MFSVRGSCGELVDGPAGVSPSGSVTSMPSCLPFPWFSERGREKEGREGERGRERLRSVSSSSLPYLTTTGRRDQVRKARWLRCGSWLGRYVTDGQFCWVCMQHTWSTLCRQPFLSCFQSIGSPVCSSSMVGHVSDLSLSGHSHTYTFSSSEVRVCPSLPLFLLLHSFFSLPRLLSPLITLFSFLLIYILSASSILSPVSCLRRWTMTQFPPITTTCGRADPFQSGTPSRCACG